MGRFEQIVAVGNRRPLSAALRGESYEKLPNVIECADGFRLSVIAGEATYCTPRPGVFGSVSEDYPGPYSEVEVGFPSVRPEPWSEWTLWCEEPDRPTDTVYAYVPVAAVRDLIALHGGERADG